MMTLLRQRLSRKIPSSIFIMTAVTGLMLSSSFAQAADERVQYTCYLTLLDESQVVHKFVNKGQVEAEFVQQLPGKIVYFADGTSHSQIDLVHECITGKKQFKSKEARLMAEKTPM